MQVRQSDITKRKAIFLQWVEGQASYLAPWWPGRSGSACWANVRSSGQHQRRLPENHTWDTPVLGSLNKREREKKKITFCKFTSKKNPSITVKYDILYQNLPQTTWRLPCFYKPYFWRTVVKPADEKTTTIKRSDHSHLELFIHSFIHVLPLPDHMLFECLLATWSKLAYSAL